ncbi:MAG: DUF177 domain-containing protein [Desulfuromonadales bacterium]|nr:DUF177 domain-containing protein [Desulfuromonadales bacterium]
MKIRIDHIKNKPYLLTVDKPVANFPVLLQMQSDGECVFRGNVTAEIAVEREFDHLKASGRVQVPVDLVCGRCLATYQSVIDSSFRIIFRKETARQSEVEDETELCDDDLIASTYSGDEIDLAHDIEEQISMEVPFKPLCDEQCKGICPVCGADLNISGCSCSKEPVNLKFSALKDFKVSR